MKDFINESYIWVDQRPVAGSSDATSDGTANVGPGVRFDGWRYATLIATVGTPTATTGASDSTFLARLQYAGSVTSSDTADTDFANFATDAVSATLTFATSDILADSIEGVAIVDVDLWAAGLTKGVVRSQCLLNGAATEAAVTSAVIILSRRNGGQPAQIAAVTRF